MGLAMDEEWINEVHKMGKIYKAGPKLRVHGCSACPLIDFMVHEGDNL